MLRLRPIAIEPAERRDQRTIERGNSFANFATNKTLATAGEQIVPVASQEQRIYDNLKTQTDPQHREPRVSFGWKQKADEALPAFCSRRSPTFIGEPRDLTTDCTDKTNQ